MGYNASQEKQVNSALVGSKKTCDIGRCRAVEVTCESEFQWGAQYIQCQRAPPEVKPRVLEDMDLMSKSGR